MKLYMRKAKIGVDAIAEYDMQTGSITVLQGSILSKDISEAPTFRGANSVIKARQGLIEGGKLIRSVSFKSVSTAANFVTGRSTNGMIAWKDCNDITLKQLKEVGEAKE